MKRLALVLCTCLGCAKGIPLPDATATQPIPAGSYLLGGGASLCASSQSQSCGAATPARPTVLTRAFDIDVYEVTVKQFAACAALDQCCDENLPDYLSHGDEPVFVTLDQARQYCRYRNRRLPTEAEWEVAARLKDAQGDLQVYPWGDSARACGDVPSSECGGNNNPRAVGSNPVDRTPLGIYDMAGNLGEWVEDDFALGVGCRYGTPVPTLCSNDSTCAANLCSAAGACQNDCPGNNLGLGQCGGDYSSSEACLPIQAGQADVDPFHVTYDHTSQPRGSDCSGSSASIGGQGAQNPLRKGGSVYDPQCRQNPALRSLEQSSMSSNNGDTRPRNGFRCLGGAALTLPQPSLTARMAVATYTPPLCGAITIGLAGTSTEPAGWGGNVKVTLASSFGVMEARYDSASQSYIVDLNDRIAYPGTPCVSPSTSINWNGSTSAMLVLTNLPAVAFDLQIQYTASANSLNGATCPISYTQRVDLSIGESPCFAPSNYPDVHCP